MKYMKELTDKDGNIIRVGITDDGILKMNISSVRYINKILTEEEIMKIYVHYKDEIIERRKRYVSKKGKLCSLIGLAIIPYNKFRQMIIDNYQLIGIPYIAETEIFALSDVDTNGSIPRVSDMERSGNIMSGQAVSGNAV